MDISIHKDGVKLTLKRLSLYKRLRIALTLLRGGEVIYIGSVKQHKHKKRSQLRG